VPPLTQSEIDKKLQATKGWSQLGNALRRKFTLKTFPAAIEFVNRVARTAEMAGHHPDIDIRYNVVEIVLSTHSAGGITHKDFALADQIDGIASNLP
jgi:4a-hydroxytetrahydrobiopterin dehydratase